MADRHCFEQESNKLVGALGALLARGLESGNCPDPFDDYCLLSLLQDQANRVRGIGLDLLFPKRTD